MCLCNIYRSDPLDDFAKFYNKTKVEHLPSTDIYHYTSTDGLIGILSNSSLRFSNRNFLNDESEGKYTRDLANLMLMNNEVSDIDPRFSKKLREILTESEGDGPEFYTCSFSIDPDSLCLWNYYSKSSSIKGYNLHFDVSNLQDFIKSEMNEKKHVNVVGSRIIYDVEEQKKILSGLVKAFNDFYMVRQTTQNLDLVCRYLEKKIVQQGVFFKHPAFSVEQEYRIAIFLYLQADGSFFNLNDEVKFRDNHGFIAPYVDIKFEPKDLLGITMSPTLDEEITRKGIIEICKRNKFVYMNMTTIVSSNIPVRY